jgi:hypothetical protein
VAKVLWMSTLLRFVFLDPLIKKNCHDLYISFEQPQSGLKKFMGKVGGFFGKIFGKKKK